MSYQEIRAESLLHLFELLFENSWQNHLMRHRSSYAFRGIEDESYELATSLIRLGGKNMQHGPKLEKSILRSFKKYAYSENIKDYSIWYLLSVAQHHGLPTRLLDWTSSPLVALHFATKDISKYNKDAAVWCVNVGDTHKQLPTDLTDILSKEGAFIFNTEMLGEFVDSLDKLDANARRFGKFVAFFEPPSLDSRIINQFGFFSIMPDATALLNDWLKTDAGQHRKIVVPKELKWEIRNKLDQMNITERVLFPVLDGLSDWLKRYYSMHPEDAKNTEGRKFPDLS